MRISLLALVVAAGCVPDLPQGGTPNPGTPDAAPIVTPDARIIPPDAPSAMSYVKEWSGCMTIANFKTAQMAASWGTLNAMNGQACANCHNLGQEGFIATTNEALMFKTLTQHSTNMLKYFAVDLSKPQPVVINTTAFTTANTYAGHPTFNPTTNTGMTALKKFYDLTVALKAAGPCPAPVLVD